MAKYYNITKSDINRVPCARIFGNDIDKVVQVTCKEALITSMNRLDGNKNDEVAIIIDLNGNIKAKILGSNGVIDITYNDDYFYATSSSSNMSLIFVHNHPDNSHISLNDIITFLLEDSMIALMAVSNNGNVHCIMKTSYNLKAYNELAIKLLNSSKEHNIEKMEKDIISNCGKYGMRYKISRRKQA